MSAPRVSVGMPVYNGATTFEQALTSVLGQSLRDVEVIVSDNGSTDGTTEIAQRHSTADPRVRYVRQDPPVSAHDNFRFVLGEARGEYFLWVASDDRVRPSLLERAREILDADPDVAGVIPDVEFVEANGAVRLAKGAFPLTGTPRENVRAFLKSPIDNSRFYGVFRREVISRALPAADFYAADWAASLATLLYGKHAAIPEPLLVRGASDDDKYLRLIESSFDTQRGRLFALLPFTRYVLRLRLPLSPGALLYLLRLNAWFHVAYCRYRYPWYGRAVYRAAALLDNAVAKARDIARAPQG